MVSGVWSSGAGAAARVVRSHPAVRTLLLTQGELSAWLLDERTGGTQQLNTSAAAVWALLEDPSTLDALVSDFVTTFDADRSTAEELVAAAVEAFDEADLLADDSTDHDAAADDSTADTPTAGDAGADDEPQNLTRAPDP